MKTYKTSEVARTIGIHPNTVRLYEEYHLIPKPKRRTNGYRIFTDLHIEQLKLARTLLSIEVLHNGLRKTAIDIIKTSAAGDYDAAISLTEIYLGKVTTEQRNAEEAINTVNQILTGDEKNQDREKPEVLLLRKETADLLKITIDKLRNWEMNGLLKVKRKQNGYRVYSSEDIRRLKIIRTLRCANYSLASILRMMNALSHNPNIDIKEVINTPKQDDDIISACDKLLTSLNDAEKKAREVLERLPIMKERFKNPPILHQTSP
jgi:DNA-binding transcriptional MerR regulator